jgi:3-deoxy-7-phosphoheptulonate synthase
MLVIMKQGSTPSECNADEEAIRRMGFTPLQYLLAEGNPRVILCERGVRTFNSHSRNTLDLNVVPLARQISHLPVLVDPSYGVGMRDRVRPLARAALAAGAHGLVMEVHTHPDTAYSDAQQTIDVETFRGIVEDVEVMRKLAPLFP